MLPVMQRNDLPQRNIQMINRFGFISSEPKNETFECLQSNETTRSFDKKIEKAVRENVGMDSIPMSIYNRMVEYSLTYGRIRNAMFFVCMANWGMRISDLIRVKFAHVIDENGNFRDSFSLENGEKKTGKKNRYYNNEAVKKVISMYLNTPSAKRKRRFDYLFTSESGNGNYTTLLEIEREENFPIEALNKMQEKINVYNSTNAKKINAMLQLYVDGKITEEDFLAMKSAHKEEIEALNKSLLQYQQERNNFQGITPNAENIQIQNHITSQAAQKILKTTLMDINVYTLNCKDKKSNTDLYINTHSLRKTFTEEFYSCGKKLDELGELNFNTAVHKLVQDKLMHKNVTSTNHYTKAEQEAFKTICMNINIGLKILDQFSK